MTLSQDSFGNWLIKEITSILTKKTDPPQTLFWFDPEKVWKEILQTLSPNNFELWAEDLHELELRSRLYHSPPAPRVIYLPKERDEITYLKVYEIQSETKQLTLHEALSQYGVAIPSELLQEIKPLLPAHVKEWLDKPQTQWKELTAGNVKENLVDDEKILQTLASPGKTFQQLFSPDRFSLFTRRITEDFGLPNPRELDADIWRKKALSTLVITEVTTLCLTNPPDEREHTISPGLQRDRALKLLKQWTKRTDCLDKFEALIDEAEATTTLRFWANSLNIIPEPLSSHIVEKILFKNETEKISKIQAHDELTEKLQQNLEIYKKHAKSFWAQTAKEKIPWKQLQEYAEAASLLTTNRQIEKTWRSLADAKEWYLTQGWKIDQAGEKLFIELGNLPRTLTEIRARLRRAYLLTIDRKNAAFSQLLEQSDPSQLGLQYSGDVVKSQYKKDESTAVLFLDACRYDLGQRLSELLNEGEPKKRAQVFPAIAPIPSITSIGMPYALPGAPETLSVTISDSAPIKWVINSSRIPGDLTNAYNRKEWLKETFNIEEKALLKINDIIDAEKRPNPRNNGKTIFIFGTEFDSAGHEGQLELKGAQDQLERYATAIRILRDSGYNNIIVTTDHGYFHRDPEADEITVKPTGEILWTSRRAIVGHNLKHPTALKFPVSGSDLQAIIPRSINIFKAHGDLGFFHGGTTLQELIIPVIVIQWPRKAKKIEVFMKPVTEITSLAQRVEVAPKTTQTDLKGNLDENLLARKIKVKIIDPSNGKIIFKSMQDYVIHPGGKTIIAELQKVEEAQVPFNSELQIQVYDSDDEEILNKRNVTLKVQLDEWF